MQLFQVGLLALYVTMLMEKSAYFEDVKIEPTITSSESGGGTDALGSTASVRPSTVGGDEDRLRKNKETVLARMMMQASGMVPPDDAVARTPGLTSIGTAGRATQHTNREFLIVT
jgi:hypothetical protein